MQAIGQLAGAIGYADLLLGSLSDKRLRRYAQSILASSQRAADLTAQLRAFARKGQYLSVPVDLHPPIAETIVLLQESIDRRIEIHQDSGPDCALVLGDPTQLQNLILNRALNGRDAMPAGGRLVFATAVVEVAATQANALAPWAGAKPSPPSRPSTPGSGPSCPPVSALMGTPMASSMTAPRPSCRSRSTKRNCHARWPISWVPRWRNLGTQSPPWTAGSDPLDRPDRRHPGHDPVPNDFHPAPAVPGPGSGKNLSFYDVQVFAPASVMLNMGEIRTHDVEQRPGSAGHQPGSGGMRAGLVPGAPRKKPPLQAVLNVIGVRIG